MTDDEDEDTAGRDWPLDQDACLEIVKEGVDATELLGEADRNLARRFRRLDTAMVRLLEDVREHFPDATYYTGSGGFNLMLGRSHGDHGRSQHDLLALSGNASISDGDF